MARIRYIKPEFFEDTKIAALPITARLLYIGLWCFMDRLGLFEDNPRLIKRNVFPYDDDISSSDVSDLIQYLVNGKFLYRLKWENHSLLYCPTFTKNQKLHPGEKPKWGIPSNLLAASKQPTSNPNRTDNETVGCAGIGIGIGTGTGIGIGTGTGTGTGTADDEEIRLANERLLALRATMKSAGRGLEAVS